MSDEWIVQFGGVFVELEDIRGKGIRKCPQSPHNYLLHQKQEQEPSLKTTSHYVYITKTKHMINICNW